MIPVDAGFVYPKTGLDADLRFDTTPTFLSGGSLHCPGSGNGTDEGLDMDNLSFTGQGNVTISFWVKTQNFNNKKIFDIYVGGERFTFQDWSGFQFNTISGASSSSNTWADTPAAVEDGQWHHIALSCSYSAPNYTATLYVDGIPHADTKTNVAPDVSGSSGSAFLGAYYSGANDHPTANYAHFAIWHAALTQAQVKALMTASTYADAVSKGGSTPRAYFLLGSNATDSVGAITYTTSSSTAATVTGPAVLVRDRARLPSGLDLSGNRRDAKSASGRCVDFDGSGDGLRGTTTFDINGSGDTTTLSCWFNADSLSGTNTTIVGNTKANATNNFAIYRTGTNEIAAIAYYASSTSVKVSTGSVLQSGKWYHAVATFDKDSATIKLYVDGKEYSATPSLAYGGSDNTFEIGYRYNSGSPLQPFSGKIADVKMFDIAFTAAQALEQYQNPEQVLPTGASASNLKRWYPLNDYDISGANNLNGVYLQDCSGNGKNLLADNCGMAFNEHAPAPQLGLRSSSSRLYFDQDDDKVTVGNNAAINGLFGSGGSIALWVNIFSDGEGTYGRMIETAGYKFFVQSESSGNVQVRFDHTWGTNGTWVGPAASIALGTWTHLVLTYNGSSIENDPVIYINGSSVTVTESVKPVAPINADTGDKVFGANSGGDRTTHGIISEIAYYKGTVLDADAVTVMYNGGVQGLDLLTDSGNYDNSGDVDGWWKLDNPLTIADLSTNSNTGTVAGTPNMVTIPEGATAGSSAWGSLTNLRAPNGLSGAPGVYGTSGRNSAWLPAPAWGTDPFTITYWFYSPQPIVNVTKHIWSGTGDPQITVGPGGTTTISLYAYASAGTGNAAQATATSSDFQDKWVFVCARKHSNTSWEIDAIPLDGTAVNGTATTDVSGSLTSTSAYGVRINGGQTSDSTPFYRGTASDIMDVRMWQGEAITDAQMNALYESGARKARGLTR